MKLNQMESIRQKIVFVKYHSSRYYALNHYDTFKLILDKAHELMRIYIDLDIEQTEEIIELQKQVNELYMNFRINQEHYGLNKKHTGFTKEYDCEWIGGK